MQGITNEQIDLMKGNMKQTVDHMSSDNLEDCFTVLTSQYKVLKQLFMIEGLKQNVGISNQVEEKPESIPDKSIVTDSQPNKGVEDTLRDSVVSQTEEQEKEVTPFRPMYQVERKLRGAYVPYIDGFIPEKIVRNLGLEHGDYVYAEPIELQHQSEPKRFEYELAKKSDEIILDDRVEYTHCPVEKDAYMYVVNRSTTTGEQIRVDDAPFTVLINDSDIERFDIHEGDVVDIAFYESNPSSAKVIWKHGVQGGLHVENTDKHDKSDKKQKKSHDKSSGSQEKLEQVFKGYTICIVGDEPNKSAYKTLIEERGGTHLHVEPSWSPSRIETMIKKADIVVGLYDVSSHTGLEKAKEYCKDYNVPFEMISGRGKTKTIQTAIDLLQNTVVTS